MSAPLPEIHIKVAETPCNREKLRTLRSHPGLKRQIHSTLDYISKCFDPFGRVFVTHIWAAGKCDGEWLERTDGATGFCFCGDNFIGEPDDFLVYEYLG